MRRGSLAIERRARFDEVRYANCWEDAAVTASALAPLAGARCLSIASAGDNSLSLLARGAGSVLGVDVSPAQLALVALKAAAFRDLSHPELVAFLGAGEAYEVAARQAGERLGVYRQLRQRLSPPAREFWDARTRAIGRGVLHAGRLERYFRLLRRCVVPLAHAPQTVAALFEPRERAERERFHDRTWDTTRWRWLFRLFFGRRLQGWLGRDREFLRFAEGDLAEALRVRVREGLTALDPAQNPYLRFILTGAFGPALPDYLLPEHHPAIRDGLERLHLREGAVEALCGSLPGASLDAFNLSDVAEYMDGGRYRALLVALRRVAVPGARLAYWNLFADRQRPPEQDGWLEARSEAARALHRRSRAFFYSRLVLEVVR